MHTMWKGSLSFGLVNVPVRMYAATESKDVKLRYLHKDCQTPIQYTRTCPTCKRPVEWDEIVRGYEYEPNRFVVVDPEELESVEKAPSHTIDIVDFVQLPEIDPVYYDKTYYLSPEASGVKAYALLKAAMERTGKIAVAKTVLRNVETLACVRIRQDVVVMETLFWPAEVRTTEELPNLRSDVTVSSEEMNMAVTLIEQLATSFQPEKYTDERRTRMMELIEQKVAKEDIIQPRLAVTANDNIVDLMQALQESIKRTQPDKEAPEKRLTSRQATVDKGKAGAGRRTSKRTDASGGNV